MKLSGIMFLFEECLQNIRRNGLMSLATLGTITVSLTVLGAMLWTAHRVNEYASQQPQKFNQVDVFMAVNAPRDQTDEVSKRISALPGVQRVHLVPKEAAWQEYQSSDTKLTEAIEGNPLPDKLEVMANKPSEVGIIADALRNHTKFPEIVQVNDAHEEVQTLLGLVRLIRVLGIAASSGLFVATLFLVQNTIRMTVFARRREIRIMQLVGATPGFIRFPMLLEGLFHGTLGALLASGIVLLCGREVSRFVLSLNSPLIADLQSSIGPREVVLGLLVIGAFVGLVGSFLSMRRFLRQI